MLCRVGIKPPGIEVRFQDIFIETSVYTNVSRNLPSILNAYRGFFEVCKLSCSYLCMSASVTLNLHDVLLLLCFTACHLLHVHLLFKPES